MLVKKREDTIAFLLIVIIGIILQYNYIDEFPRFIHAWAQSDRYSIALGFVNNHLNLFKPETFVLNHQFPNEWMSPSNSSITAVDFPIHEYIIAIFMKLFGSTAVWIFRVYTLIYSFVGLFFLYKLAYLVTKNYYKAVFLIVFAATSPVFVYYQSGFLPTIPSFANVVIGIYLYCKYA
ncbi:MAG TPA: glycosyltransferase family 39 protein, partial [Bacteroidia bacterium]|nr:glycosyltransferase family 39 protein [Bacteroidia bacterium]